MNLLILLFILAILGIVTSLIIMNVSKKVSGFKIMLLGINLTLFGGIIALDTNLGIEGIGYLIALTGLIFSFVGLGKKD